MKTIYENKAASVKTPAREIKDDAKVRMGNTTPMFPVGRSRAATVADARKVQARVSPPLRAD